MHVKHGKLLHSQSSLDCWSHSLQIDSSLTRHMRAYHTRQDLSVSCKALPVIRQRNITLRHHVQSSNFSEPRIAIAFGLECFQAAEIHGEEIDSIQTTPAQGTGSDSAPTYTVFHHFPGSLPRVAFAAEGRCRVLSVDWARILAGSPSWGVRLTFRNSGDFWQ
jgi:hypothetical protein